MPNFRYSLQGNWELLIKWKGLPNCDNSWELYRDLKQLYLQWHLEDKVPLDRKGNVKTHFYVKKRRGRREDNTNGKGLEAANGNHSVEEHAVDKQQIMDKQLKARTTEILYAEVVKQHWQGCYGEEKEIGS